MCSAAAPCVYVPSPADCRRRRNALAPAVRQDALDHPSLASPVGHAPQSEVRTRRLTSVLRSTIVSSPSYVSSRCKRRRTITSILRIPAFLPNASPHRVPLGCTVAQRVSPQRARGAQLGDISLDGHGSRVPRQSRAEQYIALHQAHDHHEIGTRLTISPNCDLRAELRSSYSSSARSPLRGLVCLPNSARRLLISRTASITVVAGPRTVPGYQCKALCVRTRAALLIMFYLAPDGPKYAAWVNDRCLAYGPSTPAHEPGVPLSLRDAHYDRRHNEEALGVPLLLAVLFDAVRVPARFIHTMYQRLRSARRRCRSFLRI
ncbi:hypothetical protein C2E23DRAFT_421624 [Lenzites betulinus]|nr:hypothetical protein C2E23DRAFT_421624 [Lenzites betulinus]